MGACHPWRRRGRGRRLRSARRRPTGRRAGVGRHPVPGGLGWSVRGQPTARRGVLRQGQARSR
eukprot:15440894-Alexandrium_andersonii.AAC.1